LQLRIAAYSCIFLSIVTFSGQAAEARRSGEEIYQQVLHSTAWVRVYQDNKAAKMGTGFLVDRYRKLLVTNQHVVDNRELVEVVFPIYQGGAVLADKKKYIRSDRPIRGWVIATDPKRDLAVIELEVVPHATTAMKFATDSLCPGESVHLVGNPGTSELLWVYNTGKVHQVSSRKLQDGHNGRVLNALLMEIRTQNSVIPGYSGGPAVNDRGELVGVATMSNPAADWAWCVDITEVRDVVRLVSEYPKAARRLLNPRSPADQQDRETYNRMAGPADHAIAVYNEVLRREPTDAGAAWHRGAAFARRGEWDQAVADFTQALRADPNNALVYYNRALAYSQKGAFDPALADFQETLRLEPNNALAYFDRGLLYSRTGAHALAVADFDQVVQLESHPAVLNHEPGSTPVNYTKLLLPDPSQATAYNSLAWIWATSPDAGRRDGKRAVLYATKACELVGWKATDFLNTLAAAYAECGKFKEAVACQKRTLEAATGPDKERLRQRLELYQAGKPFHEK
jgi:tetratricopeptide (TPR) repeat protein